MKRSWLLVAALSAVATACNSGAHTDPSTNGTRLVAGYWEAEDGTKAFDGTTFDTKTGRSCLFETAADGENRCLPARTFIAGANTMGLSYLDADCTIPILARPPCRGPIDS